MIVVKALRGESRDPAPKEKNIWWGVNMRLSDPTIALH